MITLYKKKKLQIPNLSFFFLTKNLSYVVLLYIDKGCGSCHYRYNLH
jgi:hypothetical protein